MPDTKKDLLDLNLRLDAIKAELEEIRLGEKVQGYFASKDYSTEEAVNWFYIADQSIEEAADEIKQLASLIDAIENPVEGDARLVCSRCRIPPRGYVCETCGGTSHHYEEIKDHEHSNWLQEEEEEEEEEEDDVWLGPNGITSNSLEKLRNEEK